MISSYKFDWPKMASILFLLCAATAIALPAQTFTTLVNFNGTNGSLPLEYGSLTQGLDGSLYGSTGQGGSNSQGTVFKVTLDGILTTVYSFCAQADCVDGSSPAGVLIQATNGDFYGTTRFSAANTNCITGCGTFFRLTPGGTLITLYSFTGGDDGAYPLYGVIQAPNGNFYGTTSAAGALPACYGIGCGTVFKVTPGGTLTTLHSFFSYDGSSPVALIEVPSGIFYGATLSGGLYQYGTIFQITPTGTLTMLDNFEGTDGYGPNSLIQGDNWSFFYGTTGQGGANDCGTVFKMNATGTLTKLHSFNGTDGSSPTALIQATDGNFYGTAVTGGNNSCSGGCGTIFKITSRGSLTVLHAFSGSDGAEPTGLVQDTNGTFYGTTTGGGTSNDGTVFSLSVGLAPFVKTLPTSGKVGSRVKILGTDLTGATSVTFNGLAATFTVVRPSEITTAVPTGATTGKVEVVTPTGTLSSNVVFRVP